MSIYFLHVDRMYLSEIGRLINRKDVRPVRNWCNKNKVSIFRDSSGEFVTKRDFDLAYDYPLIQFLKKKYGNNWRIYYETYLKGNLIDSLDFKETENPKNTIYVPKGKISRNLLNSFEK